MVEAISASYTYVGPSSAFMAVPNTTKISNDGETKMVNIKGLTYHNLAFLRDLWDVRMAFYNGRCDSDGALRMTARTKQKRASCRRKPRRHWYDSRCVAIWRLWRSRRPWSLCVHPRPPATSAKSKHLLQIEPNGAGSWKCLLLNRLGLNYRWRQA